MPDLGGAAVLLPAGVARRASKDEAALTFKQRMAKVWVRNF
jgi:hypothetical protein